MQMLSPLDRGQSGRLLCEEGAKELVKRSVCSFPSPPNHLFLSDRVFFCKKCYSCIRVWYEREAGPGRRGAGKSTLHNPHGPRVNPRSAPGEGRPCGGAHGLDRSSWQ